MSISEKELKLTAALYASKASVLEHVRKTGRLPLEINTGGLPIAMRHLTKDRGTDITTPDEQLVYDAIVREGRLPGGSVCLVNKD